MSDSLGRDRLIGKFKDIAKEMSGQLRQLETVVTQTEDAAANQSERVKWERRQVELVNQLLNNAHSLRQHIEQQHEHTIQAAEEAITTQINIAQIENQFRHILNNYTTAATLVMAILSDEYLFGRIIQNDELLNRILEMTGYSRVQAWLDNQADTKELDSDERNDGD